MDDPTTGMETVMNVVYELRGAGVVSLFDTRKAAEDAMSRVPKDWGRNVGGRNLSITTIRVHQTADEWANYTGMGR